MFPVQSEVARTLATSAPRVHRSVKKERSGVATPSSAGERRRRAQ